MKAPATSTAGSTGDSSIQDLFLLSDEQILEIEPEAADAASVEQPLLAVPARHADPASTQVAIEQSSPASPSSIGNAQQDTQAGVPVLLEPPPWLAAQMKDPWSGSEAKEFWDGVQQARSEAAAYRAAFASPEDARAIKELYPGGVSEARAAAERGRLLEEIDRAYFGAAGNSPEQTSASRAQLAQRMLREDPAAFREMVAAGLQALQEAERGSGTAANQAALPRLAQVLATNRTTVGAQLNPESSRGNPEPQPGNMSAGDAHVAAYAAFERAANEDLERSVGSAIERTLEQALPVAQPLLAVRGSGAQAGLPGGQARGPALRERLSAAIRQDIEKSLQGDRQLGEQVAQILSSRRFDNDARTQVVRIIADRAQQLVPGAAKRVLHEWTQTTLAAHRGSTQRADSTSSRADVAPTSVPSRPAASEKAPPRRQGASSINYRKLSDEQILDL